MLTLATCKSRSERQREAVSRSEEHTSELQSHRDLHSFPTRRSSDLYGSGLRVMECVRLRVKDVDLGYLQITIREAKGGRQCVTMVPVNLVDALRKQVERVAQLHREDLSAEFGEVDLPGALARQA